MKEKDPTKRGDLERVTERNTERTPTSGKGVDRTLKIRMPDEEEGSTERLSGVRPRSSPDDRRTATGAMQLPEAALRVRMSAHDAHYGGSLVDGARMLGLFGDLATELLIRKDGDEGLFRAYESVEFLAPVRAGDYIEVVGRIVEVGNTSRKMSFEAWKVIVAKPEINDSAAELLDEPVLVCRAIGTCVVPKDKQRLK